MSRLYAIEATHTLGYVGFTSPTLRNQAIAHCREQGLEVEVAKAKDMSDFGKEMAAVRRFVTLDEFKIACIVAENNFINAPLIPHGKLIDRIEALTGDFSMQMRIRKAFEIPREEVGNKWK